MIILLVSRVRLFVVIVIMIARLHLLFGVDVVMLASIGVKGESTLAICL
jgi:hypothetical protein